MKISSISADFAVIAVLGMWPKKKHFRSITVVYMRCAVYIFQSLTESGMTALVAAEIFGSRHAVVSERGLCGSVLPPLAAGDVLASHHAVSLLRSEVYCPWIYCLGRSK